MSPDRDDNDFGLLEWQKSIRHFCLNAVIDVQVQLRQALARMAGLERFLRDEMTTEKLREYCKKCPFKNEEVVNSEKDPG